ncbi:hypothetical protein [Sagittula stellata]|uniref:Uncharacterized protein n=1 Tax=Sagittula stellata (strain ATCC 700073 / DSM 11524 / E-37) TaxID=388399 RepID=A3K7X7_SAGS3|nr:hypothetical protein [Sagittula stellata]EBA06749.1 hypothetical protein SSE37_02640 [Sagittula stellata E-37]
MTQPLPFALAIAYAGLAACPVLMHFANAAGAPLGRLTVGGRFPGRLPPVWRALALVQAALLSTMAGALLARSGVVAVPLAPLFWPALGLTLLSLIANAASPSRPERLLWTPVLFLMAAAALGVGLS